MTHQEVHPPTTNPANAKPDEVWSVDPPEARRGEWTGVRCVPGSHGTEWRLARTDGQGLDYVSDDAVRLRHRLVPAREVTRNDLPGALELARASAANPANGADAALDAVVAHLNANGGLPADDDRWCRAHAIVEQERDQAREQRDDLQAKLDSLRVTYKNLDARANKIVERVAAAERERDEADDRLTAKLVAARRERDEAKDAETAAIARANNAEDERDKWQGLAISHAESITRANLARDDAYTALTDMTNRAEAAEARTAVSREQVEDELNTWSQPGMGRESLVNLVCRLFGVEAEPADPVEPEGDVIVRDAHDRMWWVTDDGWTNGTSRLDHDWADVPKPIRVTYRAESETKR